jgi:tRNA-modifying protein YgfZ
MTAGAALLFDRAVLEIGGEDRASFLQGLVTNDVAAVGEGQGLFAGLLTPQGKILFDFFIAPRGDAFLIDCPKTMTADLIKRLTMYRLRAKVTIADASARWRVGASWGDGAVEWATANAATAYPDPRLPELGFRVFLDEGQTFESSAQPEDYEAHRIRLAIPEGGKDYAYGDAYPHDACYDLLNGVSFKKGCFVGQEVVSRMQHRGTARTRVLAVSAQAPLPQGGADVLADGSSVGRLGSAAGEAGVALARLDRVRDALAKRQSFTANGVAVELFAPSWATYSLTPEPAGAAS